MTLNHCEKCLGVIGQGASELQRGDLASAEQLFRVALAVRQSMLPDLARDLLPADALQPEPVAAPPASRRRVSAAARAGHDSSGQQRARQRLMDRDRPRRQCQL